MRQTHPLIVAKNALLQMKDIISYALSANHTAMLEAASTVRDFTETLHQAGCPHRIEIPH